MIKLNKIADNTDPSSLASRMRRQRTERFLRMVESFPAPVQILDVGGTANFWKTIPLPSHCSITLLNTHLEKCENGSGFVSVVGDARKMDEFSDGKFDICFSNSVIEHVGTLYDQISMGREIRRVSKAYFIQTPNRNFPIEPHFLFPGWQFLPVFLRAALLRRKNFGWMKKTPDALMARAEVEQVRLLNATELGAIFPDATIFREKIGPFTKSIIASRMPA